MELGSNNKAREYINDVCSQVRFKEIHKEISLEIQSHITELAEEYLNEGFTETDSINKAVAQMGDAITVGNQLNKVHKSKPEWGILALTFMLASFGIITNYLIATQGASYYNPSSILIRSLSFSILGIAAAVGLYFFDYKKIKPYSKYIYIITSIFIIYSILFGRPVNGLLRFSIGPFVIPVEACLLFYVIALSGIMDNWNWNQPKNILYSLGLLIFPIILMLAVPSLDSILIYSTAFLVLAIMSGAKLKYILGIIGSEIIIFLFQIFSRPYRVKRFFIFLNPNKDPSGSGYINIQLSKVLHSAGLLGQGFTFKPGVIPEVHTDFIFAYVVYTFGWIAGLILIALFISFIVRIAGLVGLVKNNYGKLLLSGFAAVFSIQFLWNILMVLGLAPLGGTGLPFISYGGTQFIINMIVIGLILGIYRRRNIREIAFYA
ncbi:lipid II flippase FtsW [Oxobacter pfennigii]|uniref:Lipid II flippase FtsW n=1 Tax=Oxobacter pfennigii TaxID=36849 RepID=A0A0P8WZS8_9CLOT|nr:FtsW/RodA/SpoVE family cell cycle protein [Oxobacter pfennigii]KPU44009.1 lipid II flippase FtsW [Oxobacter pfennigii]